MGTTALRQLLKSLCSDSPWKYAVLWKLQHGSSMILTWEDGYIDCPKSRESRESVLDETDFDGANDIFPPQFEASTANGTAGGYPIGFVVAGMSCLQYEFGKGIVGKVAVSGIHCWFSFKNMFTCEVDSKLPAEHPEEWLLQFASGIKTILLVPVLPHGVLQLGSLEEVAEDFEVVTCIKGRFHGVHCIGVNNKPFTLKRDIEAQSSCSMISFPVDYSNAPPTIAINRVKSEDSSFSMAVNSVKLENDDLSMLIPLVNLRDAFRSFENNLAQGFESEYKSTTDVPSINLTEVSTPSESMNASQLDIIENKLFELSCLMEELQAYSASNDFDVGVFGECFNGFMNSDPPDYLIGESRGMVPNDINHRSLSNFLTFPRDCELHKALGSAYPRQSNKKSWDSSFVVEDSCSRPSLIYNNDINERTEASWCARGSDAGYLLDTVAANAYSGLDNCISNRFNSLKSSTSSLGDFAASCQQQIQPEATALVRDGSLPFSHSGGRDPNATPAALKSIMSTIFCKEEQEKGYNQPCKAQMLSSISKRRARPGDKHKPKPRDRQLIQDRLKELRELVPNSTKCSIDGLLDKTIKHMLYLRSVTDQAEKLRQWVQDEVATRINLKSTQNKDNPHNGMSWAFEFGSDLQMCPIVAEDLTSPGHMLIEMLCNEEGLFLEIAQVIRGLELTILKGVMKSRSDNTWAHFIVEASKGFHRLDIFWPLMQLLQRRRNPISSKI